ncbi:hypothetical protein BsWGS_08239 [Bradybaena similaris]
MKLTKAVHPWLRLVASRGTIARSQYVSKTRPFSCLVSTTPRVQTSLGIRTAYQLTAKMSLCRQNYPVECEAGVNRQISLELYASYVYLSMAYHFDRDDVALPGFYGYFKNLSKEESEHANKLMKYQNLRGGRILLQDIKKPEVDSWGTGLEAMMSALKLEKHVNQSLIELHNIAESKNDVQFEDFLEDEFLKDQVEAIKQISDFVTQLNRVGPGLGEYIFDRETLQEIK